MEKLSQDVIFKQGFIMRMWLLLILLVCLAAALFLGYGTSAYEEKSAEIVSRLEDL